MVLSGGSDARYVPSGHLLYALGGTLFAVPFDVSTTSVVGNSLSVEDEEHKLRIIVETARRVWG